MKFYFDGYAFDGSKRELLQNNTPIPLRTKGAEVLALLLSDPDKIFSKNEILESVWGSQVVSEQAVFQNISDLRVVFGEKSIKTYAKRGYQWQIPLQTHSLLRNEVKKFRPSKKIVIGALALCFTLITLAFLVLWASKHPSTHRANSAYVFALMPLSLHPENTSERDYQLLQKFEHAVTQGLEQHEDIRIIKTSTPLLFNDFAQDFNHHSHAILSETGASHIIFLNLTTSENSLMANVGASGEKHAWGGTIESFEGIEDLSARMVEHLLAIRTLKFLHADSDPRQFKSELISLRALHPEDPIILQRLISALNLTHDDDTAEVLATQEIERHPETSIQHGIARFEKAKLLAKKEAFDHALEHQKIAANIFRQKKAYWDWCDATQLAARIYRIQGHYEKSKKHYLDAADMARNEGARSWEVYLYIELATMASHLGHREEGLEVIRTAELLLDQYALPKQHYSGAYLALSRLAENATMKEHYLKRVLAILKSDTGFLSELVAAKDELAKIYIQDDRWNEAIALIPNPTQATPQEQMVLANIYHRWGKDAVAVDIAEGLFNQAVVTSNSHVGLDSALLLFEIHSAKNNIEQRDVYRNYVAKNAGAGWKAHNKHRIEKSKILENPVKH